MSSDEEHQDTNASGDEGENAQLKLDDDDNSSDSDGDNNSDENGSVTGTLEDAGENMANKLLGGKSDKTDSDENDSETGTSSKAKNDDSDKEESDRDKEEKNSDSEENDSEKEKSNSDKDESNSDKEEKDSDKEESDSEKEEKNSDKEEKDSDKEESDSEKEEKDSDKEESNSDKGSSDSDSEKDEQGDDNSNEDSDEEEKSNDQDKSKDQSMMMITEISNVVKPPKKPKGSTGRRMKPQTESLPSYSDDEILDQINIMMKEKKLPDECYHQPIRNYISRFQLDAAERGDYKKAEELETYLETLTDLLNQDDSESREKMRKEQVEEKIRKVKERHEAFLSDWNAEREKKLQEQEQTQKAMEDRHQKEIDLFQAECNDQVFIQRYNKPSQNLINLRKAENQFAMAKLFDRAKHLKKQADDLQQVETKEAEKKMSDAVMIRYQAISERQEREKECLEQHNQSILELLDRKKEKEQLSYEKALNNLNTQLEPPPNKDKMEKIKPQATKRPIRNNIELTKFKSPATLDIPSIDVSKFRKTKKIIKPTKANNTIKKREK
ncbi:hypothetical protein M9Y10_029293 [Tritrichomonas musculus]|uniref:Uncharacterized protein n=1 Tax=Tritrichomonas musculus TaxID=1915356 RepID=A0ABR2KMV6_9EUKA